MKRRRQNILLVEPPYKSSVLPLSLQKFATYHLNRGDNVTFTHDPYNTYNITDNQTFHKIYITSVFTYYGRVVIDTANFLQRKFPKAKVKIGGVFASLMPDTVEKYTGLKPHISLYPLIEDQLPDFTSFPKVEYGRVVTTRGCVNKCEFCAVPTLEPKFKVCNNWQAQIQHIYDNGLRLLDIQDNNFLAAPKSHQRRVCEYLRTLDGMGFDFNQALEAKLFKDFHSKLLMTINLTTLRFAFDGMHEDGYFQDAVKRARKDGFKKRITVYILFNYEDTPEDFYHRLMESFLLGCSVHPMKYAPLSVMNRKYIGTHWSKQHIKGLHLLLNRASNIASSKEYGPKDLKRGMPYKHFGRNAEEFVDMITNLSKRLPIKHFSEVRQNPHLINSGLGFIDKTEIKESREKAIKTGAIIKKNFNTVKTDYDRHFNKKEEGSKKKKDRVGDYKTNIRRRKK
jgi:hypothetical protein